MRPLLAVLLLGACTADVIPRAGEPCPCVETFTCCSGVCIPGASCEMAPTTSIDRIEPSEAPIEGGIVVTVHGDGFSVDAEAQIGGLPCQDSLVASPREIVCLVPPGRDERSSVAVTVRDGETFQFLPDGFRYVLPNLIDWQSRSGLGTPGRGINLTLFDLEGDGDLDMHIVRSAAEVSGNRAIWFENTGDLSFRDRSAELASSIVPHNAVASADFTGDGLVDVVLGPEIDELGRQAELQMLVNDGETFSLREQEEFGEVEWLMLAPHDVDGDSDVDLVGASLRRDRPPDEWLAVIENEGSRFVNRHPITLNTARLPPFGRDSVHMALGDYDGDGDPDVLACGDARLSLPDGDIVGWMVLARNDDGTMVDTSTTAGLPANLSGGCRSLSFVDFDSDGDLDIAYHPNGRRGTFLMQNDAGVFSPITALDTNEGDVRCLQNGQVASGASLQAGHANLVWLDHDSDGDVDLFMPTPFIRCPGEPALYDNVLEDGQPGFRIQHLGERGVWFLYTFALAAGDLDGDGDVDIIGTSHGPEPSARQVFMRNNTSDNAGTSGGGGHYLFVRAVVGERDDPAVTVWLDLDGPEANPDFAPGRGKLRIDTIGSAHSRGVGGAPRAHFGLGVRTDPVWVRVQFADGTRVTERIDSFDRTITVRRP